MTSPQPHDDPVGEARGQLLQALAVLTTVGEAAARFAVAGVHNRTARTERRAEAARLEAAGLARADQLSDTARTEQDKTARRLIDHAYDQQWLAKASINDTAELWRTAAMYAATGDARSREAMRLAEGRLRQLNPVLTDAYARHRVAGMNLTDAMRAATNDVWQHELRTPARPHGNSTGPQPALRPTPKPIGTRPDLNGHIAADELDAAVRNEVLRLADGVDPDLIDRVQRQWRSAGHAPAADAASMLAIAARHLRAQAQLGEPTQASTTVRVGVNHPTSHLRPPNQIGHDTIEIPVRSALAGYQLAADGLDYAAAQVRAQQAEASHLTAQADQQLRRAAVDQAQPDLPATVVDEHRDGQTTGHARVGRAEQEQAAAAQLRRFGQAFPPLRTIVPTFSPAPTPPTSQPGTTRRRGTVR